MSGCRKRRYQTPVDAMLALDKVQGKRRIDDLDKYERTYYWCASHEAYHLTSWKADET